jgi:hypothetical protein
MGLQTLLLLVLGQRLKTKTFQSSWFIAEKVIQNISPSWDMGSLIPSLWSYRSYISESSTSELTTKLGNARVISLKNREKKKMKCQGVSSSN